MKICKKILAFAVLMALAVMGTSMVYGETSNYEAGVTAGTGKITVISKLADGTVVATEEKDELEAGNMAKLIAKDTVEHGGVSYNFSHFEYHTSARDYIASYENPMDIFVDPPMTVYAVYGDTGVDTKGMTGFYKDPVVKGGMTYFFCAVAGTKGSDLTTEKVSVMLGDAAKEKTVDITVEDNSNTATTHIFPTAVKSSMQFVVAADITTAINAEVKSTNYNSDIGRTRTWDFGSDAFLTVAPSGTRTTYPPVNGLTITTKDTPHSSSVSLNDESFERAYKFNKTSAANESGDHISFSATKGDVIYVYGTGSNNNDAHLAADNAVLAGGTGNLGKQSSSLSVHKYIASSTGNVNIYVTNANESAGNGYIYCVKVNPFNAVNIGETPDSSSTTTTEAQTETTTSAHVDSNIVSWNFNELSSITAGADSNKGTENDLGNGLIFVAGSKASIDTSMKNKTYDTDIGKQNGTGIRSNRDSKETTEYFQYTLGAGQTFKIYYVCVNNAATVYISATNSTSDDILNSSVASAKGDMNFVSYTNNTNTDKIIYIWQKGMPSFIGAILDKGADPTKGALNVTVKNLNGASVTGAAVTAESGGKSVTLNEGSGVYTAMNIDPGEYTVKASKSVNGKVYSGTAAANVTAGGTAEANVTLDYATGNISITVTNKEDMAVTNANVTAKAGNGDAIKLEYDTVSGAYTAKDIVTGTYTVTAELNGVSNTASVTVEQGKTANGTIQLDIDPSALLYVDVQSQLSEPFNTTDTTTVTNYSDLQSALSQYNKSADGGTIYINAERIECEDQLKLNGTHVSLVGVPQQSIGGAKTFPVLDFSKFRASTNGINAANPENLTKGQDSDAGIRIQGNYNMIQNLIVEKAPDNGIQLKPNKSNYGTQDANYNIIENCIARYNNDTGIQVSAPEAGDDKLVLASYNSFKWCYSYRNCDVYSLGGNADGFAPKLNPRTGNVFDHCYAWDNSDDGWDGYDKKNTTSETDNDVTADVTYLNSACWNNGNVNVFTGKYDVLKGYPVDTDLFTYELLHSQVPAYDGTNFDSVAGSAKVNSGPDDNAALRTWADWAAKAPSSMNGNGFKFGSADTPKATQWTDSGGKTYEMKRIVKNCLAFDHKNKGFDNNNTESIYGDFTNTVAFDNGYNYHLDKYNLRTWTNILSFGKGSNSLPSGKSATTPSADKQSAIRSEVEDKAWRIYEACRSNVIPGNAEFNIYN